MSIKIISIIDPDVLAIPIQECGEAMVDLKEQKTILLGESPEISNNQDYTKVRVAIYEKLLAAQKNLPSPLRFCLYEGYRSLQLQEHFFNQRYHILKQDYPDWEHPQIFHETIKRVLCPFGSRV